MSNILWTATEIAIATGGESVGDLNWKATGLTMDSREVQEGDVFIALTPDTEGDKYRTSGLDGHDFVQSAFEKGAVGAIVSRQLDLNIPQIVVEDTFEALEDMGQVARHRAPLKKVVAITGSVGKTGVRSMVDCAFQAQNLNVHASIKSYNNAIGVPFSLATMPASSEIGIFEVGMNYPNEITPLSNQIAPDIAIITWVDAVHIENFEDGIDGIVSAKCEIFNGMGAEGVAILPRDNPYYATLVENAKKSDVPITYSFGEGEGADARLLACELRSEGTWVKADVCGEAVEYTLKIAGKHIALNSLSALLAVHLSNGDVQAAAKALEKIEPIVGRGKREEVTIVDGAAPIILIDESYNASPVAMRAALKVLSMIEPKAKGRRIAIFGDMLELGKNARKDHEDLLEPLQDACVDQVYCCGDNMGHLYESLSLHQQGGHAENSEKLKQLIDDVFVPGDVVLVKGSLGSKMKIIVEAIQNKGMSDGR